MLIQNLLRKNIFYALIIIVCFCLLLVFLKPFSFRRLETQDILVSTSEPGGVIYMDHQKIGINAVCIPSVPRGDHHIEVVRESVGQVFSSSYFVSDNIVKEREGVKKELVQATVELSDCETWKLIQK